jgi:hypothetical protein
MASISPKDRRKRAISSSFTGRANCTAVIGRSAPSIRAGAADRTRTGVPSSSSIFSIRPSDGWSRGTVLATVTRSRASRNAAVMRGVRSRAGGFG